MQYVYVRWKCNRNTAGHLSSRGKGQENKRSGGRAQTWDLCSNMDFQQQKLNIDSDHNPLAPHWKARNVDHTTKFDA